MAIDDYFRD